MPYLTTPADIRSLIAQLTTYPILWLDTEVADWQTPNPKLSLIQVLFNSDDRTGEFAYILDVLDRPDLIQNFVVEIMCNEAIEKVFHNAAYDLKFLGGDWAQNVTCTFKIVRRMSKRKLGISNRKLKTLAKELCHFTDIDIEEQTSDWGRRPLSQKQLHYARMDTVYLAHVHQYLLQLNSPKPAVLTPPDTVNKPTANPSSFSVTQVRVAFECARLFYLGHHFGGMTMFLPPGKVLGIGSAFHDLSNQFVKTARQDAQFANLFNSPVDQLKVEPIATQMQALFYDRVFFPYLQSVIQTEPSRAPALLQLWNGLKGLIRRWATLLVSNRQVCSAEEVIEKTFLVQELSVQHQFLLPNGTQQQIRGRFDSLVYDFANHRLCVVEYKTYQSLDQSAQLAQVALYSYMLRERIGVPIDSAVYTALPDWKELTFTWNELETTVHHLIPHKLQQMQQWLTWQQGQPNPPPPAAQAHLCDSCPQRQKCQTFFPDIPTNRSVYDSVSKPIAAPPSTVIQPPRQNPIQSTKSPSSVPEPAPSNESDRMGERLVETLQSFGIETAYQGAALAPAFIRVKLKPNPGVKVNSILRLSDDLRVQLGLTYPPLIAPQAGYVSVDLPRPDRQLATFDRYIPLQAQPATAPVQIAIGVDLEGQLVEADLSDPNTCHFLVGGTTGSGKSEFLRSLLLSLLVRHSPDYLKIGLVDPKRVTFPEFEQIPWLYTPVVKDSDRAIALMNELVAEMDRRYQQFEQAKCPDLATYNQHQAPMPRIVCIFDEYADFMAEKETRSALELNIKRLGAMARAAGIHLIIATQRPEAKVVTPLIRSNLPGRVALRTASEADSAIILGGRQIEAAYLLGKGDLLYQAGAHLLRLQSLFAPSMDDTLSQLIAPRSSS
ncbi:DNA translocase FtsK [Thermocoleostomius sinensis]|uniref:DNA translocase FtsK n=1 Tax=Thermocoleostomius sinensis A174 TaxID=2016057 RepID=A0A9E8ZFQ8_9CYAN|nr:DNA translocase FtsK [Thermocoleostomius sinensis]WAL60390.1 DNA translocase FtsK [Thermocoleostomius sinensis A174]